MENMQNMQNQTQQPQAAENRAGAGAGEKTFTQDDVNRIVQERLAKERERGAAELAQREADLAGRELRMTAREMLAEKGLPAELLEALNCSSAEALEKSVGLLSKHIEKPAPTRGTGFSSPIPGISGARPFDGAAAKDSTDGSIRRAMGLK